MLSCHSPEKRKCAKLSRSSIKQFLLLPKLHSFVWTFNRTHLRRLSSWYPLHCRTLTDEGQFLVAVLVIPGPSLVIFLVRVISEHCKAVLIAHAVIWLTWKLRKSSRPDLNLFLFYTLCKEIHFHKLTINFWENTRPYAFCMGIRFFKYLFSVDIKPGE